MKKAFVSLLVVLAMSGNVHATIIGGAGFLDGDVAEAVSPCHAYVIRTWFVSGVNDGRAIMAQQEPARKFGFSVDDLLYISMLKIMDSAMAYKEALRICGLYAK